MFLSSRIQSSVPEIIVAFLIFSLSSGVVGGVLLYLDSAGPDVLSEMSNEVLADMQVHFRPSFYEQNETTVEQHRDLVLEQDFVSGAESVSIVEIYDTQVSELQYSRSIALGIETGFPTTFPNSIDLADYNFPLNSTNCYVQRSRFEEENLKIGSNFTISVPSDGGRVNRTFTVGGTFESKLFMRRQTYDSAPFSYLYIITERNSLLQQFSDLGHSGDNSIVDQIWVSFSISTLLGEDPSTIVSSLRNVEKKLEQRILPDAAVVDFTLIGVFYEYSSWVTGLRVIAMAFSIPSIIMGFMLIQYNSNLEADQQRRNVGTLKTRGASGSQSVLWILTMSVFVGIIGSIGALLTGIISAFLAGGVRELMIFDLTQMSSFGIVLLPSTIVLLFLFSFTAGLLVTIPIAIKAFLMTAADAHSIVERDDSITKEKMGNPVYQVGIVGISGLLLIPLVDSLESFSDLSVGSAALGITIVILLTMFIISLTLLLARPSAKLKAIILLRIKKPSLIVGSRLMGKNAKMFGKSEGTAVVFISLVFTAGLFSALSSTTGNAHMKELFMFNTGADVVVNIIPGLDNVTLDFVDDLLQIDGVAHASGMVKVSTRVVFYMYYNGILWPFNQSTTVYGIQPNEFAESAFLQPYFTYYNDPAFSIRMLEDSADKTITNFRPIVGFGSDALGNSYPIMSDSISIEFLGPTEKHIMDCEIVDVMASTPSGFVRGSYGYTAFRANNYLPGEDPTGIFVIVDIDQVHQALNITKVDKFYIDLLPGANYSRVVEDIWNMAPSNIESVDTPFDQIDTILDTRAGQSIYGAYTLNVIFSIIYLTAGITLVSAMKVKNMKKHFSLLRALGTQPVSILGAVLTDSVIGVLLGAIVGGSIGTILTFIIMRVPLTYLGLSTEVSWDRLPLSLSIPIPLVVGILGISIVASLIATYLIVRRGLKSNIANDIQHSE